jgi:acyl dehydratase
MNLDELRNYPFPERTHAYSEKDTILYALGLGYGSAPGDPRHLRFLLEDRLLTVPSLCNVIAQPFMWVKEPRFELNWIKLLHGEQRFEVHQPLPAAGSLTSRCRVLSVEDKGEGRGVVIHFEKTLWDPSATLMATIRSAYFLRGDGGKGGFGEHPAPPAATPDRAPDRAIEIPTLPQSALIYRLSGDVNPIHADPEAAREAGFERPILHGLCTLGIATRAAIEAYADAAPERLAGLSLRFSRPVYPGETIVTEFFETGDQIQFRARVGDVVVLDRGSLLLK